MLAGAWIHPIPLALKLNLSQGATHWVAPADGPTMKPRYLPAGAILKVAHLGIFWEIQSAMSCLKASSRGADRGINKHLPWPKTRPAKSAANWKIGSRPLEP